VNITFTPGAWEEYQSWTALDKKIAKKIAVLVKDIARQGLVRGLGKPEKLKNATGYSRRLTSEHPAPPTHSNVKERPTPVR
jgi:toxin YoeB